MNNLIASLSSLPYTNPFSPERLELEKSILKEEFQPYKNRSSERHELANNQNLIRIAEIAHTLSDELKLRILNSRTKQKKVFEQYEDLAFLLMYYQLAGSMDEMIARRHNATNKPAKFPFYRKFIEMSASYFEEFQSQGYERTHSDAHLFAIFFQIRRAYYHIFENFIGRSETVRKLREDVWTSIFTHNIRRYARSFSSRIKDSVTLITGPSGTGKELVARAIGLSQFIPFNPETLQFEEDFLQGYFPLNLSALSQTIIESELFGHKKGAFTGANEERAGFFESCGQYGTVFLDEIGEVNESTQVKLLRLLQTRSFQKIGDTKEIPFQGKLIAATNRDLDQAIEDKIFREDFYYRLCSDRIHTPSFREMIGNNKDELIFLFDKISEKLGGAPEAEDLSSECQKWAEVHLPDDYPWPGNFREFEQCVRNIMIRGTYTLKKDPTPPAFSEKDQALNFLVENPVSAKSLIETYASAIYQKHGSIQSVSEILELDRRTARKNIRQLS
jgi:transcriptional regulator with PAS, ATPase and Fis domain